MSLIHRAAKALGAAPKEEDQDSPPVPTDDAAGGPHPRATIIGRAAEAARAEQHRTDPPGGAASADRPHPLHGDPDGADSAAEVDAADLYGPETGADSYETLDETALFETTDDYSGDLETVDAPADADAKADAPPPGGAGGGGAGGGSGGDGAGGGDGGGAARTSNRVEIDLDRLAEQGFVTPRTRRGRLSEEIRLIKRRLLREMPHLGDPAARDANSVENVIMMTSSKPSEGKTFLAANLALSFAVDEGLDVLLIDADVTNPSIPKLFGLTPSGPGLIDLLTDASIDMPETLMRDERLRLSIMDVGTRVASATELFGSRLMQEFVVHIARRYPDRIIIFDTPPVLASTEPMVLCHAMGHVLLAVAANQTPKDVVKSAIEYLEPADNVKLVLNKAAAYGTGEFGSYKDYD